MRSNRLLSLPFAFAAAALIFVACGSDTVEQTESASPAIEDDAAVGTTTAQTATEISFANDVKPVLEANCVSCHSDTGPGTTHLLMEIASDVSNIAEFVGHRVEEKQMPPWPLSGLEQIAYQYDLSMDDADRQTIIDWATQGGKLDVEPDAPLTATSQTYPPIDADLVITADVAYPGSNQVDDYRCRVLDPEFFEDSWITSIETRPDETRVLHHSLIYRAEASDQAEIEKLDGSDGAPGWTCQTVPRLSSGMLEQVAGWAPGTGPITMPDGSGLLMEPGDVFVVQWHYHYDENEPLPDNSGIAIELATDEELAAAGGALDLVYNQNLLGPVEIPCATYESGPLCERDAAMTRIADEFGFESTFIPSLVNRQCDVSPADFAQFTDGVASSSCDIRAPRGQVISMWPHMHELGTTYRLTLNPDTPEEIILIDIDRWDFQWQMGYYPVEDLHFESGDILRLECGWDRALWPAGLESRYVVWAEGTQDEMCFTGVALR